MNRSFAAAIAIALAAPALAQTGIDGSIGSEWTGPGVFTRTVSYDAMAAASNFGTPGTTNHAVAYTTYFRGDGAYIYAAVQANPAGGGSASGLQFANLYFSTVAPSNGSIGMEVNNNRFFRGGVSGYTDATGFATWSSSIANGVIEVAIPYSFFQNDPLGMGFATATSQVRFNLSQSFGYSVAGGTVYNTQGGPDERLGLVQLIPLPPAAWAGMSALAGVAGVGFIRRRRALQA